MINYGLLENSKSFVKPKMMLTEVGIKSCITRPEADYQRRSEWLKEATEEEAEKPVLRTTQRPGISLNRVEEHHQVQDTTPTIF